MSEWIKIKTSKLSEDEIEELREEKGIIATHRYDCPMPEVGQQVQVTTKQGDVTTDYFEEGYFCTFCEPGQVIAWAPLLDAYNEDDKEDEDFFEFAEKEERRESEAESV